MATLLFVGVLLALQGSFAAVSMFGCERFSGDRVVDVDSLFGSTCEEATTVGKDYSRTNSEIVDGRTFLLSTDADCCTLCRSTPGCKAWTRFVEAGVKDRPQYSCWLSSSVPTELPNTTPKEAIHSGIVPPAVYNMTTCLARRFVGFNDPHYNDPYLLMTQSEKSCCLRCKEQRQICKGWAYDDRDQSCRLFAITPQQTYFCRTCISGTFETQEEAILPAEVTDITKESCGSSNSTGSEGIVLKGSPLSIDGAFISDNSRECCQYCSLIRECRSWTWIAETKFCSLFDDLPSRRWRGKADDRSGVSIPKVCHPVNCSVVNGVDLSANVDPRDPVEDQKSQNFLALDEKECCFRCQEIPSCRAWTYFTSKQLCWTISFPSLDVHSCSDCVSSVIGFRFVTANDIDLLKRARDAIGTLLGITDVPVTTGGPVTTYATFEEQDNNSDSIPVGVIIAVIVAFVALLICVPLTWQLLQWRRKKRIQAVRKKIAQASALQSSFGVSGTSASPLGGETAASGFRHESIPEVTASERQELIGNTVTSLSADQQLSERQAALLHKLLMESRQKGSYFQFRSATSLKEPGQDSLYTALSLEPGMIIGGKYEVEPGTRIGSSSAIVRAHSTFGHSSPVVLKFFRTRDKFVRESTFYSDTASGNFLPDVLDIYDGRANEALGLPPLPCLVLERGDNSLEEWLSKQSRMMDQMDQRSILYKVSRALQFLHERMVVHRDLKPGNIVVFAINFSLKLIDLGSACRKGESAAIEYTLRYAAPEIVSAHLANASEIITHPSADMWALGSIFWEVLVGEPLFGAKYSEEEVMAMLVGLSPLPFDREPEIWNSIANNAARRLVQSLLRRNPDARWPIQKVLSNGYFSTGTDTVAQEESLEAMGKQLQQIAEGVDSIRQGLIRLEEISIENLRMNAASALLSCFSFVEIDPSDTTAGTGVSSEFLIDKYIRGQLTCQEAYLEPNYNIFRRQAEEPISLLRIGRKHLLKISLMTAGETKIEVPISELLWVRISPTDVQRDTLESNFALIRNEGHVIEGVCLWDTERHRDLSLKLSGKASVDVEIGFKLKNHAAVTTIHKKLHLKMHTEKERFRTLRAFNRSKALFSSLPLWAKVYIHGTVTIVKIALG